MIQRYYAANDGKALLKIFTTVGRNDLKIHLSDKELNWHEIELNDKQCDALMKFLNDRITQ